MNYIDLSHAIEEGMPGFRMRRPDGTTIQYAATIRPFLTHEESRPFYGGAAEFEITELQFQTSIGTYLDSPYHRYSEMRDIGGIRLEETILPGVVVNVRERKGFEPVGPEVLDRIDIAGRAVLFNFGWDRYWGMEEYYAYPFIARETIDRLIAGGARLVGVDTINVDDTHDPQRPAHSRFLRKEIFVLENLRGLDALHGRDFRLFAVPLKVNGAAAMPVRAFAEVG